jgi:pyridoxamine 5'-phosphate oxidase
VSQRSRVDEQNSTPGIEDSNKVQEVIADLRVEYRPKPLLEIEADPEPLLTFRRWFADAAAAQLHEANAMTLATVGADGRPSARIMLMKDFDEQGITFFTNYTSRKGEELAANPYAAAVFWWGPQERQVRVEGPVTQVSAAESDDYFRRRPRGSRLGAWVSAQSKVIPSREVLEARQRELEEEYNQADPPRPPHWGGYRLAPEVIEFWQGGPNRIHDRLRYSRRSDGSWLIERLSP